MFEDGAKVMLKYTFVKKLHFYPIVTFYSLLQSVNTLRG